MGKDVVMWSRCKDEVLTWIDYLNGKLWVDEFVTHHQDLENINKGFDDMHVSLGSHLSSPSLPTVLLALSRHT